MPRLTESPTLMPASEFNPAQIRAMLQQVAERIIDAEPLLSDADRKLGDGDHGLGMKRGMEAALKALSELDETATVGDLFGSMGMAMMSSMGGASGVVFGSMFRAGTKALKGSPEVFTSEGLAAVLEQANESIMKRGGAKPGDKTMIDALDPAQKAARLSAEKPLAEALENAALAAEAGRDHSEGMIATMGRAKTLGEESIGHPDAGACSVAIILRTMADCAAEN